MRDKWSVYVCPECDELNLYRGICDNFQRHSDPKDIIVTQRVIVEAIFYEKPPNPLSRLQQDQAVPDEGPRARRRLRDYLHRLPLLRISQGPQ